MDDNATQNEAPAAPSAPEPAPAPARATKTTTSKSTLTAGEVAGAFEAAVGLVLADIHTGEIGQSVQSALEALSKRFAEQMAN